MDFFNKIFENKRNIYNIGAALLVGAVLMALGGGFSGNNKDKTENRTNEENSVQYLVEYEERIENKIEDYLKNAEGVGDVKASVAVKSGREKVVQNDVSYQTDEKEMTQSKEKRSVYSSDNTPFVVVEREPLIEGVVIVCSGGGDVYVKQKIISSVSALLGVEVHKIEVLKMK